LIKKNYVQKVSSNFNGTGLYFKIKPFLRNFKRLLGPFFDNYLMFLPAFVKTISHEVRRENVDFMISTYPPGACHWTGHWLKKKFNIPWVADFRDPWGLPEEWNIRASRLSRFIEKAVTRRADLLMAVSSPLQEELLKRYAAPVVTVENGFDPEEFDGLDPENIFPDDGKLRFIYSGQVYWKRNPTPFFAAIRELLAEEKLLSQKIEILFYGRDTGIINKLAKEHNIDSVVKTLGLVERSIALRAQRDANGLLFLEGEYKTMDYVLPVKLFEYLRSGTPIIGIGMTAGSTAGNLMEKAGVGFPLGNDVIKMKEFILSKYINQISPSITPNWEIINNYSRDVLAQKALQYIIDNIFNL
jgi:glycosyltransferase involved in cell wall biosynthesis